jgi:hypothetical protein
MMNKLLLAGLGCALALSACATPTRYGPAMSGRGVGYSELPLEPGRFRITFRGGSGGGPQLVQDLALLRAAELTLANGGTWFQVANRSTDVGPPSGPAFSFGIGGASFGRHSALGLGTSTAVGGDATYVADLEIVVGRGPKPDTPETYDARAVSDSLRARLPTSG